MGEQHVTSLEIFRCEKRNVKLTKGGCARMWELAATNKPKPWEGQAACVACPIGAANAGHAVKAAAQVIEDIRMICAGCFRPSDRMIAGDYCPSCYNRRLEAKRGRNAKGGTPRISALLHPEFLAVAEGQRRRCIRVNHVLSLAEAVLIAAKDCEGEEMRIGWVPIYSADASRQVELRL